MTIEESLASLAPIWGIHAETASTADAVYATLREAVISGQLKPGESLIEEQIARQFNVSRTPVREALMKLEAENLGTRIPRRGLVIRRIAEREVLDVYTVRVELDSLAARLSATHARPPERARLHWINQQIVETGNLGDISGTARLSSQFHIALAEASHNTLLLQLAKQIQEMLTAFASPTYNYPGRALAAAAEHDAVLKAIDAGDAERAAQLARDHIVREQQVRVTMLRRSQP
ncbi:MAG: GntR family transcriptional regulator [Chloroflexi bacterium]|nr:GntR family transcriptional regulator [Chloroflexota bacterium]